MNCSVAVATAAEGANPVERMQAAQTEVANVRSNIFITLVQLDQVRGEREPAGPRFQAFTNQLARMETLARALGTHADEMKARGNAYFAEWDSKTASLSDPGERRKAEEQLSERKRAYNSIVRSMQEARKNFRPFVDEVTTIKTLLEESRDADGVKKAKDLFMRANWHCIDVQRSLMEMEAEFDTLIAGFRNT